MADLTDTIRALIANLRNLGEDDAKFARSLIFNWETRGLTEKQEFWVGKLLKRATGVPETTMEAMGDLEPINALFAKAAKHLQKPAIVLGYAVGHQQREIKVYPAGERSSTPGAIQVKDTDDGRWFGRILTNGQFEHSRRDPPPTGVSVVLRAFAEDPAGTAAAHGHLTGRCCFCNRKLSDERSTAVGYGATCAEHFGVPWGMKAARAAQDGRLPLEAPTTPAPVETAAGAQRALPEGHDHRTPDDFQRWADHFGVRVEPDDPEARQVVQDRLQDVAEDWREMQWEHEQGATP